MADKELSPNSTITVKIQYIVTYSIFLVSFGASIYTLYDTLPKISQLSDEIEIIEKKEIEIRTNLKWLLQEQSIEPTDLYRNE
jgi:hypothetical protein